jgi:hypothetical protein
MVALRSLIADNRALALPAAGGDPPLATGRRLRWPFAGDGVPPMIASNYEDLNPFMAVETWP